MPSFIDAINRLSGDSKIQTLTDAMTKITTNRKNVSTVTFQTSHMKADDIVIAPNGDATYEGDMIGFVLWLPREKYIEFSKEQ